MFFLKTKWEIFLVSLIQTQLVVSYVSDGNLFPYSASSGSTRFEYGDDDFTSVSLTKNFKFLGKSYSTVYINGNGIITFGAGARSHKHLCNASEALNPTISVYMADSINNKNDESKTAELLYRETTAPADLAKAREDIVQAFPLERNIQLNWMLIVTWLNTSPYRATFHHLRNTFQAVLTSDGFQSFVIFYYNQITWPTKEINWFPAEVGILGGPQNLQNSYLVPGSCNYSLINIPEMSNFDKPGKFAFQVNSNIVIPSVSPTCSLMEKAKSNVSRPSIVHLSPSIVAPLGIKPIYVHGLASVCLKHEVKNVKCSFQRDNVIKHQADGQLFPVQLAVFCQKPDFDFIGKLSLYITLTFSNGDTISVYGNMYVVQEPIGEVHPNVQISDSRQVILKTSWNPTSTGFGQIRRYLPQRLNNSPTSNFINFTVLELAKNNWRELYKVMNQTNNGKLVSKIPEEVMESVFLLDKLKTKPLALAFSNTIYLVNEQQIVAEYVSSTVDITLVFAKFGLLERTRLETYTRRCQLWYDDEAEAPNDTMSCPDNILQAEQDWRFYQSKMSTTKSLHMNLENFTLYLQMNPSPSGASAQCVYDNSGNLVLGPPFGSHILRHSPNNQNNYWDNYRKDIVPFMDCCVLSFDKNENCLKKFYAKRHLSMDDKYQFPLPFGIMGAAQITSLNQTTFIMNSVGTFWLLKYSNEFKVQTSLQKYSESNKGIAATIVTSAVISFKCNATSKKIQISTNHFNKSGMLVWLDDEPLNFYDNQVTNQTGLIQEHFHLNLPHVSMKVQGDRELVVSHDTGISLKFQTINISLAIIGTVSKYLLNGITGFADKKVDYSNASSLTMREFAESCRVRSDEFLSVPGFVANTTHHSNHVSYQLNRVNILKNVPLSVQVFCNHSVSCMVDYQLTSDKEFAESATKLHTSFENLVGVSNMNDSRPKCKKPRNVLNGIAIGNQFEIGNKIQYNCNRNYTLRITTNNDVALNDNVKWTCISSNFIDNSTSVSFANEQIVTWINLESNQPLENYQIQCVLSNEKEEQEQATEKDEQAKEETTAQPENFTEKNQFVDVIHHSIKSNMIFVYVCMTTMWIIQFVVTCYLFKRRNNGVVHATNLANINLLDLDAVG